MPGYRAILSLVCSALLYGCAPAPPAAAPLGGPAGRAPSDATYFIDGTAYPLSRGEATIESAPGSASKTTVRLLGEPVSGDLDGDQAPDAALLLVQTTGGSGTFYYAAAALERGAAFLGTPAVFLGDRISPRQLAIRHGVVIVDYADRRPGEAMATTPSQEESKYLVLRDGRLAEVPLAEGEMIAAGEVVLGHEVRSFTPCSMTEAVWLTGDSPALPALLAAYHRQMSDAPPYTPLFMVLTGQPAGPPSAGFGADHPAGFRALQLVHTLPGSSCAKLDPQK